MIKQLKAKDRVDMRLRFENATDVAQRIAYELHGYMNITHGVRTDGILAPSGLCRLMNKYLAALPHNGYNGAYVIEQEYDDTLSLYIPDYK